MHHVSGAWPGLRSEPRVPGSAVVTCVNSEIAGVRASLNSPFSRFSLSDVINCLLSVQIPLVDAEFSSKHAVFSQWELEAKDLS